MSARKDLFTQLAKLIPIPVKLEHDLKQCPTSQKLQRMEQETQGNADPQRRYLRRRSDRK